jgi:hypothetical protein
MSLSMRFRKVNILEKSKVLVYISQPNKHLEQGVYSLVQICNQHYES